MSGERHIVLKQQRDLSRIVEDSLGLCSQHGWRLLAIAAVLIPLNLAEVGVLESIDDPEAAFVQLVLAPLDLVVSILVSAALVAGLVDVDAGGKAGFTQAYSQALEHLWILLAASLRAFFHVFLFAITIIGIPWAIQRIVRWLFVVQAVMLDGTTGKEALSQSANAVEGSWWRALGISALVGVMVGVTPLVLTVPLSFASTLLSGTIGTFLNVLLFPFGVAAATLLYLDLKTRKESHALSPP